MIEINLLPSANILSKTAREAQRVTLWFFGIASGLLVLVLLGSFGAEWFLAARTQGIIAKADSLQALLAPYSERATGLRTLKYKIAGIGAAVGARSDFGNKVTTVQSLLSPGATITNLALEANGEVTFTARTADLNSLNLVLSALEKQAAGGGALTQVVITGMRLEPSGGYSLTVKAKYARAKT